MNTICITNQKGGVGKTTTTLSLGAALAEMGYSVGLVGLDSQRDLGAFAPTMMRAQTNLSFVEATAGDLKRVLMRLQKAETDFILIDCPPALGREVVAALKLSHLALVPLQAEVLAVRGLAQMMDTVGVVQDSTRAGGNPALRVKVLVTMFDSGDANSCNLETQLRERLGKTLFSRVVKRSRSFNDATLRGRSILQHASRSHAASAYRALAREISDEFED